MIVTDLSLKQAPLWGYMNVVCIEITRCMGVLVLNIQNGNF